VGGILNFISYAGGGIWKICNFNVCNIRIHIKKYNKSTKRRICIMYTAYDAIREKNIKKYGIDGPEAPKVIEYVRKRANGKDGEFIEVPVSDLEKHAIHFIRKRCEELRFNPNYMDFEDREGYSLVDSKNEIRIPYNMEKDTDRLCLETAVHRFLESGVKEDAFDIYYIFLEMFFGEYKKTKKMIESLSEVESNASSLLMKHRDHYSHSVYVFLIGLAIYDSSESYRKKYNSMYNLDGKDAAHHFLKYWGLSALFHDIGYPFELPFEEVKSYFGENEKKAPYVCYKDMDEFVTLDEAQRKKAKKMYSNYDCKRMDDILIYRINECLGKHYNTRPHNEKIPGVIPGEDYVSYLTKVFRWKPADPKAFGGYMDHGYFSAMVLMKNLFDILDEEEFKEGDMGYTDALTAIVLHNSIFKRVIQANDFGLDGFDMNRDAIRCEWHPLAYLLMLCDELQCWDRTSYGQNSRLEVHAMGCDLKFDEDRITAVYKFDKAMEEKANRKNSDEYLAVGGTYKKMYNKKSVGERGRITKFQYDIEEIVALNREGELALDVEYEFTDDIKYRKTYLSQTSFMHLYDFAVILSGRKKFEIKDADKDAALREKMEAEFEKKPLEYKLIDIERVKKFAKYLDAINSFYTDKPVAYPPLTEFTKEDMDKIGPLEHERWLWGHHVMGWKYGKKYEECEDKATVRELTRTHKLMLSPDRYKEDKNGLKDRYNHENAKDHYDNVLDDGYRDKDTEPMNKLLNLLSMLDGVKFYRLVQEEDDEA
jgi:hypothetical protein